MNVEQYLAQELGITNQDMMGNEMPIDSSCGAACKSCIDAAKQLIEFKGHRLDCDAQYTFTGHIYTAFGKDFGYIEEFTTESVDNTRIVEICISVCQCYIFG